MQNYILYTNNTEKATIPYDIRSEILFREAEDCYFYFMKIKSALKKLTAALNYYPYHFKSLMLKGDILFGEGKYDEALKLYARAYEIHPNDFKVLGSVANCLNELKFYTDAEVFCNKALECSINSNDETYSSIYELKIKIEMNLRHYGEVKNLLNTNFVNTHENLTVLKHILSKTLDNKIELKKKLQTAKLRAI